MCGAFGRFVVAQIKLYCQLTDILGKVRDSQGSLLHNFAFQPNRIIVRIIEAHQRLRDV